jgi:hypothetical protein
VLDTRSPSTKTEMHTIDATHAREGSPKPTRAAEDDLSSSSEATPSDIDANSTRDSIHLADAGAAVPLDAAAVLAPQTLSIGFDESASWESTSEGTRASAHGLRLHSVEPSMHVANTTDPVQHAIAMTIAQPTHAATSTVNRAFILQKAHRRTRYLVRQTARNGWRCCLSSRRSSAWQGEGYRG